MANLFVSLVIVLCLNGYASAGEPTRLTVAVAAYSATRGQTDSTPHITASGLRITQKHHGKIIALSADLRKYFKFGDPVRIIVGDRVIDAVCQDVMHSKYRRRIDLLLPTTKECFKWGVRKGVIVVSGK